MYGINTVRNRMIRPSDRVVEPLRGLWRRKASGKRPRAGVVKCPFPGHRARRFPELL